VDESRFDGLSRVLAHSRRGFMGGVVAAVAITTWRAPHAVAKKRQRKLKKNQFGCVDVGKACRGKAANCCSGICQGKKPKKGKQDTSRCVAHDAGSCQADQNTCASLAITCNGGGGSCFQTTGKGAFCGDVTDSDCRACNKDADCVAEFGVGAACIICAGTCPLTQDRQCMAPA
jgi:hypothetical protein